MTNSDSDWIDPLQWDSADAEIKDPSVENPELEGSPFLSLEQVSV